MTPAEVGAALGLHWKWLAGLGGLGSTGGIYAFLRQRLSPDHCAVLDAIGHVDATTEALDTIVGRANSRDADCERIRKAYASRRRAGAAIQDLYEGFRFAPFRPLLTELDLRLGAVEDALHSDPPAGAPAVRATCASACEAAERLRKTYRTKAMARLSVVLHGRSKLPPRPPQE